MAVWHFQFWDVGMVEQVVVVRSVPVEDEGLTVLSSLVRCVILCAGSILEVTTIDRASNVDSTALFIEVTIDSFQRRARRNIVDPWAGVRAVNLLVETEGAVGGLASSITPDLMSLQKLVRDLMAALFGKSVSTGSNLLVIASQSESADAIKSLPKPTITPTTWSSRRALVPPARNSSRKSLPKSQERWS